MNNFKLVKKQVFISDFKLEYFMVLTSSTLAQQTQQKRDARLMLFLCWPTVSYAGPTLIRHNIDICRVTFIPKTLTQ